MTGTVPHFVFLYMVKFKTKETKQKQITDMRRRAAEACFTILAALAGLLHINATDSLVQKNNWDSLSLLIHL